MLSDSEASPYTVHELGDSSVVPCLRAGKLPQNDGSLLLLHILQLNLQCTRADENFIQRKRERP